MNKNLVSELVKVANSLDNMGLNKEANSLDKIARKIVVSQFESTGDYTKDIQQYKASFLAGELQTATNLFNSVMKSKVYSNEQKVAFRDQAEGIRSLQYGNFAQNWANEKLTNLINASPFNTQMIGQQYGPGIDTDLKKFTDYWISNIEPKFETDNPYVAKWLTNKFLLYKKPILEAQKRLKAQEDSGKSWWQRTFGK